MMDRLEREGFVHFSQLTSEHLGRDVLSLHWSGVTDKGRMENKEDYRTAISHGYTRFRFDDPTEA